MLFLLVGCLFKDVGDLNITFLFGLGGKVGVTVSGLGLTTECSKNVFFSLTVF